MAFAGVGFLKEISDRMLEFVDDQSSAPRWSDDSLKRHIQRATGDVISDINRVAQDFTVARITVNIVRDQRSPVPPG